jgi:hypothetical protein
MKKKCLLFKHEKNNQTLFNDWPTCCHTVIFDLIPPRYYNDIAHFRFFPCCFFSIYLENIWQFPKYYFQWKRNSGLHSAIVGEH